MGNFDSYAMPAPPARPVRSVLRHDVGPNAHNAPEDLRIIARMLASAGLLDENVSPALTRSVIFRAIRHARMTLATSGPRQSNVNSTDVVSPGDETERAVRRAMALGRLPLSHRAVCESRAPKGARSVIDGGMARARAKLEKPDEPVTDGSPDRRALLPVIDSETFQSNRRLADTLLANGHIDGIEIVIAQTIREGGKKGYSDVRDFFQALKSRTPEMAYDLYERATSCLEGKARRRLRKLYFNDPPREGDFL